MGNQLADISPADSEGTETLGARFKRPWAAALSALGAVLTLLGPAAYLFGQNYYQGYLHAFGVSADAFPLEAVDIYIKSFEGFGLLLLALAGKVAQCTNWALTTAIGWLVLAASYAAVVLVGYGFVRLRGRIRGRGKSIVSSERLRRLREWSDHDLARVAGIVFTTAHAFLGAIFLSMAISVFWWVVPMVAHQRGFESGMRRVDTFRREGCRPDPQSGWSNCVTVTGEGGSLLVSGLLIGMNSAGVAILDGQGSHVIRMTEHVCVHHPWSARGK